MNNYLQFTFKDIAADQADILIARLSAIGFDGFEQRSGMLIACIDEEQFDDNDFQSIASGFSVECEVIRPRNWNADWESSFEPVVIGNFCTIRASFHEKQGNTQYDIIITPRMSFGTGHHATTSLMVQEMEQLDFKQKNVLDFGTGTGILAILAEKLGAASILAIDNDEWSIRNARENLEENGSSRITLQQEDQIITHQLFDIILANINKKILIGHMASIAAHLERGGVLLLSGLLAGDMEDIITAIEAAGLTVEGHRQQENWIIVKASAQ